MKIVARFSSLRRCNSGVAAIEFALIAMVAIPLFFGIFEFGRALYMHNALSFAADKAARMILTDPDVTDSNLETTIRSSIIFGGELPPPTFGIESVDGVSFRTIMLEQPLVLLIPGLSAPGITLTISRRVPVI